MIMLNSLVNTSEVKNHSKSNQKMPMNTGISGVSSFACLIGNPLGCSPLIPCIVYSKVRKQFPEL